MESRITKISDLKPASYNPRMITDESFEGLKYSLEEFGDLSGIVYNKRTGNLVAGHQRVKAISEKFGDLQIDCTKEAEPRYFIVSPSGSYFPIRVVDWDLKKEKAANLAANNPKIQGEFTPEVKLLIDELSLEMPDACQALRFDEIELPLSTNFDVLKDLEDNEFIQLVNDNSKIFAITFNFANEHKPAFEAWIKAHSKKELASLIEKIVYEVYSA